ncbi:MAG: SDR family oxidoreductase [Lachnospiraceae bacterium]|nr:SDR family oxidoreductase [Lachnospiraceae bacterium]
MKKGILEGKKALITGGDKGLGYEIASEFVKQGADICICSRNEETLKDAAGRLSKNTVYEGQKVIYKKADISDVAAVDDLYDHILKEFTGQLDIVVNNAGIQGPIGCFEDTEWNEVLNVINVNLMGTLYSMKKAIGIFKDLYRKNGMADKSIINLSGGGATGARPYFTGYAVAKTGVVRATETLAKETAEYGIRINAIAPGAMNTKMLEDILAAGDSAGTEYQKSLRQKEEGGASMENAAKLISFLASERSAGVSGRLISAVWDGWNDFDKHLSDIEGSDIYTLRRIIPKDRGFDWE